MGQSLVRELILRDFDEAIAFVDRVAVAAEDHLRRPDICLLDFSRVRLTITNPHHSELTQAELRLAEKVNAIIPWPRARRSGEMNAAMMPPRRQSVM